MRPSPTPPQRPLPIRPSPAGVLSPFVKRPMGVVDFLSAQLPGDLRLGAGIGGAHGHG